MIQYLFTARHVESSTPAVRCLFTKTEHAAMAIDAEVERLQEAGEAVWTNDVVGRLQKRSYVEGVGDLYVRETPLTETAAVYADEWEFTVEPVELVQMED